MYNTQYGWQVCSKCGDLIFTDRKPVPSCKAGGDHATVGNINRGLDHVPNTFTDNLPGAEEGNWRFCANCHGLFRIYGDAGHVDHGVCNHAPYGTSAHVIAPNSSFYILASTGGIPSYAKKPVAYYECSECGSLFHDWAVTYCNKGGQHVKAGGHGGSKYFILKT